MEGILPRGSKIGTLLRSLQSFGAFTFAYFKCRLNILDSVVFLLLVTYTALFVDSISAFWFNPTITTDDSLQQLFPFHSVHSPEIFEGDLIYNVMKGYLAPLHYWLGYSITMLTGDPIMTGHWMMLIQLLLTVLFVFLGVRAFSANIPAFFAVAWFLHTRHVVQRLTAGLPRGWAAPLLAGYLYLIATGRHRLILFLIFSGCLLHPPATIIIALSYGLILVYKFLSKSTRQAHKRPLIEFLILCPVFLLTTMYVVHRPDYVGQMVDFATASAMPEFQRPGGRFPFLPLLPIYEEIKIFGFQTFISQWFNPGRVYRELLPYLLSATLLFFAFKSFGARSSGNRAAFPAELAIFALAIITVYLASRALAFKLYVPNRHIQFPFAIFFIFALPVGLWRAFYNESAKANDSNLKNLKLTHFKAAKPALLALSLLALTIWLGSRDGLQNAANFNMPNNRHMHLWKWIERYTPKTALIAGQPTHIDGVQLFGKRKGYVTTETAHPFYDTYNTEIKRRLEIVFKAYYAPDLKQFVDILLAEKIDFFVFRREDFYPESMAKASYFSPLDQLVRTLATARPYTEYAYRKLPLEVDLAQFPFMPYRDRRSVLIDVKALKIHLENQS